ncbi:TonB-dependent receptor [Bacteroides sp. BFG-638]|jgi:tonB-linked outer membrane protein, susC/ragA family|uniref:TonB-dependent receptor n=1 Tax=Bacteroides vicugnae TaxID=3037989 RepID=A0ABU5HRM9_9BACE|nr:MULTISPECIES: TonB-dependent receptor [Bacteroides]MCS2947398.1 TonB-dependent receptor [Bacteroides sp. BFG-638]MCS3311032.1 TonB-dependent receptor [Bacteroides sp. BFG-637]MDY7254269.1 TonB-dependent receptor [Bacteroides sp. A1-P5]MDY7258217.1 TonB-dependent receptor [Bacteroides sp. A2-P53]
MKLKEINSNGVERYKYTWKIFYAVMMLFCLPSIGLAQTRVITGLVFDENSNEPLIGASVSVQGTSNGVITGMDGTFSLKAQSQDVIQVSYVGYRTVKKTVGNNSHLRIGLAEDVNKLDEVVTIGYSAQKKINLTGAVATVDIEQLEGKPVFSVTEALQGTTPGLIITQPTSKPGSTLNVNIRGLNTLNDNNPLVLIDGVEGDMHLLNTSDIEQISILKDASASIYGSRGANGVILITTKKGAPKKSSINYEFRYGWNTPTGLPDLADSWVYAELRNEALINSGLAPEFTADQIAAFKNGTAPNCKWIDHIYKNNAPMQTHSISLTGGENKTTYYLSAAYGNQESLFVNNDNFGAKRFNVRLNLSHEFNKRLKFSVNTFYNRRETRSTAYWEEWIIEQSVRTPPIYEIKIGDEIQYPQSYAHNPLGRLEKGGYNLSSYDEVGGVINGEWNIFDKLTLKASAGTNINNTRSHTNRHAIIEESSTDISWQMCESAGRTYRLTTNVFLDYQRQFGKHSFDVMAGFAYEGNHDSSIYTDRGADGTKIPEAGYDVLGGEVVGSETLRMTNSGGAGDDALYSVVGRATYNYDDRYLVDFNIRNDHSSKFKKGRRSGVFPSLLLGWRMSEEKFYQDSQLSSILPSAKLRASIGMLGNDRIGRYSYQSVISTSPSGYMFGDRPVMTLGYGTANEMLKWEITRMINVGVDLGFLDNRLNVTFDYFFNRTKDILLQLPTPTTYGGGDPNQNAGIVSTKGWELNVNYRFNTGEVHHKLAANVSDSRNKVVSLRGEEKISNINILREGSPIWAYYAYKADGLFQNEEEIFESATPSFNVKPGDIKFVDKNGDGSITPENDKFVLGTRDPRYTFGFNYNVEWKGLDFAIFLQGVAKRTAWLRGEAVEAFHNNNTGPVLNRHIDRWTPTNPNASYPRLTATIAEAANNYQNSTFWLQNAAYLRVKNIQLGYTFPHHIVKKFFAQHLRVFASVQNPFTFSKMLDTGWDPEFGEGSGRTYPVTKTFAIGVDLKF